MKSQFYSFAFLLISEVLSLQKISEKCFICMCESLSGCEVEMDCKISSPEPDVCGPYQITRDYWTEAGLPINGSEFGDFVTCSQVLLCSEKVIQKHISQRVRDCDKNGRIDCSDIAASHYYGQECGNSGLRKHSQWRTFQDCVNQLKPPDNEPAVSLNLFLTVPPTLPLVTVTFGPSRGPTATYRTRAPTKATATMAPTRRTSAPFDSGELEAKCLLCLCHAATKCEANYGCKSHKGVGKICGPFQISPEYWADARQPGIDHSATNAFERCANDFECSRNTVKYYYERFKGTCTRTTTSNPCERLYRLHVMGAGGCKKDDIPLPSMWRKLLNCYNQGLQ